MTGYTSQRAIAEPEQVNALLEETGVDVLVATEFTSLYYLSGVWSTPTITVGDENYAKTGFYTDFAPPKTVAVWPRGAGEPCVILPAVVATRLADEGVPLDIDRVYVYGRPSNSGGAFAGSVTDDLRHLGRLFDRPTYEGRVDALDAVFADAVGAAGVIALEQAAPATGLSADATLLYEALDQPGRRVVDGSQVLQRLTAVKTEEEIRRIRAVTELTESVIEEAVTELEAGMTEREFVALAKQKVYERGGFEQFPLDHNHIGFGPHTAYPHVVPSDYELERGDLVRFEFGCRYERYPSDTARTFVFGEATDVQRERYATLRAGMRQCRELLAAHEDADVVFEETVAAVREAATKRGIDDLAAFDPSMVGHNHGMLLHDPPILTDRSRELRPGMVMTYELFGGEWGVGAIQLEDTVVLTEDGIEPLSTCPAELPVV